ncbi:hypothetical protein D048_4177A, partial [Vibrio parahaemolyticus VPTS-2009]
MVVALG